MEYTSVLRENRQRPKMQRSPLMFESDEEEDTEAVDDSVNSSNKENAEESVESVAEPTKEERILKGFQKVLMGIPPPPAFTVPQLDCREILKLWREHQSFRVTSSSEKCENNISLCKQLENEAKATEWPETLQLDYWDVYYNKSLASEELERLSIRYKERYVGAETSSCVNALFAKSPLRTASARKRARHRAWGHSPGRRLSHLARRRKAFSSASLCSVAGNKNPDKKMIMVEIKKIGNRQKKKGSVKKTKPTPKKKAEAQSSTFKRALFQSPDQDPMNAASKTPNTQCVQRSKRNLFAESSEKKNEFGKRERPVPKRVSPRKRVNRSLSFQESLQSSTPSRVAPAPVPATTNQSQPLSGAHKQKMLWAATNALREQGMGMSHELFRPCMTVLFRTCQRLWLTRPGVGLYDAEGSTSERMLALAKHFSSYTIREISSDPTSEHMALVYNNSLKMAETMLSQPVGSGSRHDVSVCSQQNKEIDDTKPVFDSVGRVIENNKLVSMDDSSLVAKDKNTGNKTATPVKNKKRSENTSREVSNPQICSTQTRLLKNTPSKINCRSTPRSSPRIAKRTITGDPEIKSSVCNALFQAESSDCSLGTVTKVDSSNKSNNSDCPIAPNGRKKVDKTSPQDGKLKLDLPSQVSLQRRTPLKSSLSVRETPKRTCNKLSEVNVASSVSLSPKTFCNVTLAVTDGKASSSFDTVELRINPVVYNDQSGISSKSSAINESCPGPKKQHSPRYTQTPTKKVTFSSVAPSKSCKRNLPYKENNFNLSSPPNNNCTQDESKPDSCTSSILKKTESDANYQITNSLGGRRITRSVSSDTKVENNKPIHHLFSPPTTQKAKLFNNKVSSKEVSKGVEGNDQSNSSDAQTTLQIANGSEDFLSAERRITRRASNESRKKCSHEPGSTAGEGDSNIHMNIHVESKHSIGTERSKHCLRSSKSPMKKTTNRGISQDTQSLVPVSTVSCPSQNKVELTDALPSSPEFVSPRSRSRKNKPNKIKAVSSCISPAKITPKKSKNLPEDGSPEIKLTKATLNRRRSSLYSDASSCKETPDKSVFSEEYAADTENSSGTLGSEISSSQKSNMTEKSEDNETNKENLSEGRAVVSNDKIVGRHSRHLLSVENTPTNQVVAEEPVNRMLQLYRLSTSGGDNMETEKLLPDIVCLEPPKLEPHWVAGDCESEESPVQTSPPSLAPHWEQESCSGTSTSLPESIMAHWHQLSSKVNEGSSDKVMFDFEDTSYEITFPSINEDSKASSICAPINFPFPIDDSKSGFHNVFRRSSTESSN